MGPQLSQLPVGLKLNQYRSFFGQVRQRVCTDESIRNPDRFFSIKVYANVCAKRATWLARNSFERRLLRVKKYEQSSTMEQSSTIFPSVLAPGVTH
jgi:hypothetical protein